MKDHDNVFSSAENEYLKLVEDARFSATQQGLLKARWLQELNWFGRATRRSKRLFYAINVITIVAGAITSASAGANLLADSWAVRWLTLAAGVLTTICAALSSSFRDWDSWKRRSMTVERLRAEGSMFLARPDAHKEKVFQQFLETVNQIVAEYKLSHFEKKSEHPGMDQQPST